jgi:hypothetical protein
MKAMKKLLVVLGFTAVIAIVLFATRRAVATPERAACVHLGELCDADFDADKLQACTDNLERARKLAGAAAADRSIACIDQSTTCAAAVGCTVGGIGVGAAGEFMKGLGKALSDGR